MTFWMPGDTPPKTARTVLAYVGAGNVATVYYEYKKWVWAGGHEMSIPPLYWMDVLHLMKDIPP
jgi:hypothetical protein|tara:strand:- start:667 stop:858 length:192 start_codon:yes stop_codon:yes gene_type:complete